MIDLIRNKKHSLKYIFGLFIAFIIVFFLYKNLLYSPFLLHWDDAKNIVDNNAIKEVSLHSIKTLFSSLYVEMYVPITQLTYLLDYQSFGLLPFGFHISSLIYHFIATFIVFFFFSFFFDKKISFILSIIFLVHPVNIEPIAWLSARSTIIFTLFYLLSLVQYIMYLKKGGKLYFFLTFFFFLLSVLAKSTAITLPVVLIGLDCFYTKACKASFVINKIPFFIVSIIIGYITTLSKIQPPLEYSYWENLLLVSYRIFFYISKFIFPVHYSAFYTIIPQHLNMILFLSLLLYSLLILFVYWLIRKRLYLKKPLIVLGTFLFLTTILINLNIVPFTVQIISDRYMYLPMVGLLIVLGFFMQHQKHMIVIVALFSIYFLLTSVKYIDYWKNETTLFQHTLENNPNAIPVKNIMVSIYKNKHEYRKALKLANEILSQYPNYVEALNNRGSLYLKLKEYKKAFFDFNKIITLNKAGAATYINLGNLYFSLKQYPLAIKAYEKAISLDSSSFLAYDHLGRVYAYIKKPEKAEYYLTKAISLNITYGMSYQTRGMVYIIYYKDITKGCKDLKTAEKYGINVRELIKKFCN